MLFKSHIQFSGLYLALTQIVRRVFFFISVITFSKHHASAQKIIKQFSHLQEKNVSYEKYYVWLKNWQSKGFLELGIDTSQYPPLIKTSPRYLIKSYFLNDLPTKSPFLKTNKPFHWQQLEYQHKKILKKYASIGYPFAQIVPNFTFQKEQEMVWVTIKEQVQAGNYVIIDSILIPKDLPYKSHYIYQILNIKPKDVFNYEKIQKIPTLLKNTPYFAKPASPQINFSDTTATLLLNFQKAKRNAIDFLLGLLPPQNANQKLQFTLFANLQLINTFRMAEILKFQYEKLQNLSQKLNLQYQQPYPFRLPVQFNFQFDLLKQDTSFLNRNLYVGGAYFLNTENKVLFGFKQKNSQLLSIERWKNTTWPPPPQLDTQSRSYLLGYEWQKINNIWNPTQGFTIFFSANTGLKKVFKVRGLEQIDYERIGLKQPRQEAELQAQFYFPLAKRSVTKFALHAYYLQLSNYFENELKPVGGFHLLRGFNENQFWASNFLLGTIEYRLLLDEYSFIGYFVDAAYLTQIFFQQKQIFRPIGTGIALNIYTNIGTMSLSYAIGRYEFQNFQPTKGRIHIGFVNHF